MKGARDGLSIMRDYASMSRDTREIIGRK